MEEGLSAWNGWTGWDEQIVTAHAVASHRLAAQGRSKTAHYRSQHADAVASFYGPRWWQTAGKVLLVAAVVAAPLAGGEAIAGEAAGMGEAELVGAAADEAAFDATFAIESTEGAVATESVESGGLLQGQFRPGSLANKCNLCAEEALAANPNSELIYARHYNHVAVKLENGQIVDRSLRDNLETLGADVSDIGLDEVEFSADRWNKLTDRFPGED